MASWEVYSPIIIAKQCWNRLDAKEEERLFAKLIRASKLPIRVKAIGNLITLTVEIIGE